MYDGVLSKLTIRALAKKPSTTADTASRGRLSPALPAARDSYQAQLGLSRA